MLILKRYASMLCPLLLFQLSLFLSDQVSAQDTIPSLDKKLVTLSDKDLSLIHILGHIEDQTGLRFNIAIDKLDINEKHTVDVKQRSVEYVLDLLFKGRGYYWTLKKNMVVIKHREGESPPAGLVIVTPVVSGIASPEKGKGILGIVTDTLGEVLVGATVMIKGTKEGRITDHTGTFFLPVKEKYPVLLVSYTGYETAEYQVTAPWDIKIRLIQHTSTLDEKMVIAYGTTSKRLNTGNNFVVSGKELQQHPVSNPLIALQARVPGLIITQSSGLPGTSLKIQIRGQNSFLSGGDPLFIIDGVPLAPNNQHINVLTSIASQNMNSGISPFTSISLADIANIVVLKDADATAIYGSRGANGVILITTRKGEAGKVKITADITTGFSQVANKPRMLSTAQYLMMRREAFSNDGIIPGNTPGTPGYAPDIYGRDTTRYTDWQDLLTGRSAPTTSANLFVSGGNGTTQLLFGTGYYRETSVFPSDMSYIRGTLSFSLSHRSVDNKFKLGVYSNYSKDRNRLFNASLASIFLAPNAPEVYDHNGQLKWSDGNEPFENPMADFLKRYNISKENQILNLNLTYNILPDLSVRAGFGYNSLLVDENSITPMAAQNPFTGAVITGTSSFGNSEFKSYIVEPSAEYSHKIWKGEMLIMAGASFQYSTANTATIVGQGYTNDALLASLDGAAYISTKTISHTEYKYGAFFGRLSYHLKNKYLINLSGRRDGSSKFSPEKRFNYFGAIGTGWIFSEEPFVKQIMPFLNFGKLRASYGVTGNDQINDYKYLDTWSASLVNPYQGIIAMAPDALYNPDYYWERCEKLETSLDLEFLDGRILTTLSFFRNRSDNQLIKYRLPSQTGFNSILKNFDALVQNSGWEIVISGDCFNTASFRLNAGINLTIPKNKLLRFDHLPISSYNGIYVVGESVTVLNKLQSTGVDRNTGLFVLRNEDNNPLFTAADSKVIGDLDPDYYAGIRISLQYKSFGVEVLGDLRKQLAPNYLYTTYLNNIFPGTMYNQLDVVLDRWQQRGDNARYPRYSTKPTGEVYAGKNHIVTSNEAYSRAGYFKLRNLSVSYNLKNEWLRKKGFKHISIFCKTQNLFTITRYKGGDPETANILTLPTLRTIAGGLGISL